MKTGLFERVFERRADVVRATPGRVNLIGSHTDYNGGMVLPVALPIGTEVAVAVTETPLIRIFSSKFEEVVSYSFTDTARGHWADYAAGAVITARKRGLVSRGVDVAIEANLPAGAGISSSASVIVGVLKALRRLGDAALSETEIAQLAREVENAFIGLPCGIMDQMAVAVGRTDCAMALDTGTLAYELVPLPPDLRVCVIHSGIDRALSDGRYARRAEECLEASAAFGHRPLCQLRRSQIEALTDLPETLRRRARHCSAEHQRVLSAIGALKAGQLETFGRLISASHASLRDDFEISLPDIDDLVSDAVALGALGARLTGGGFGGCIVACIKPDRFEAWISALLSRHPRARLIC